MAGIRVIADDLSGAAEIAAMAADHGIRTLLYRNNPGEGPCAVIDTDSRHANSGEAKERISTFGLSCIGCELIYKKTDSVLRGHIAVEILALMSAVDCRRVLLLPQNPSKGRIIQKGHYAIGGTPLHLTDFRNDPEYPRMSSSVEKLLGFPRDAIKMIAPGGAVPETGVVVCEAADAEDVAWWARKVTTGTIPAGGADFFGAILADRGLPRCSLPALAARSPTLIVCGSAAEYSREMVRAWRERGLAVCPPPEDLDDIQSWAAAIEEALRARGIAIVAATQGVRAEIAFTLRHAKARVVREVLSRVVVPRLFVEGGATAAAVTEALGWDTYAVEGSLTPGVALLHPVRAPDTDFVLKPGSYPWPTRML